MASASKHEDSSKPEDLHEKTHVYITCKTPVDLMFETVDPAGPATAHNDHNTTTGMGTGNDITNRHPAAADSSSAAAFHHEGRVAATLHHQHFHQHHQAPGSPYNNNTTAGADADADTDAGHQAEQHQPQGQSAAVGSLNAFLNGAYASGPMAGGKLREGGGGSARGSSVGVVGGGGGASGSVFGVGGVEAPLALRQLDRPLQQLIETKERELHEIHDFRIRCVCASVCVW